MSCQVLSAPLTEAARHTGTLTEAARHTGTLAAAARPVSDGPCRTFDFSVPEAQYMVTFDGDLMVTFDGDAMATMV